MYGAVLTSGGVVDRGLVDLDDGAGHRGEELGDGLGGLHLADHGACRHGRPDGGQLEVDDVTERLRRGSQ